MQLVSGAVASPADGTVTGVLQVKVERRCEGYTVVASQDRLVCGCIDVNFEDVMSTRRVWRNYLVLELRDVFLSKNT